MSSQDPNQDPQQGASPDAQPTGPVPPAGEQERLTSELPPADSASAWWQQQSAQETYQQTGYQQGDYPQSDYQQGGYPPAGYSQPTYGYAPPRPPTDDKAVWALVSSVAGFFLCPIVLHVVGWVLANQSLRAIRESRGALGGDGIAKAARVLGIVGVVLYGVLALLAILAFAILIPLGIFAANNASDQIDAGSSTIVVSEVADIDGETFNHDIGDVSYDLTAVDFAGDEASMAVDQGAGSLVVTVPDDIEVVVDAQVGAGDIDLFGQRSEGINLTRTETSDGAEGAGTLNLDLAVGVGTLEVSRG